jgi:O-antigen/teichoic acid export membrane protein
MSSEPGSRIRLRDFVTDGARYAIGGMLGRGIAILAVPIYIRHLTPGEYALQALALLNEQVLVIVAAYAATNAVGRFYAEVPRGSAQQSQVIRTALVSVALGATVVFVLVQAIAPVLAMLTLEPGATGTTIVRLVGVSFLGNCLVTLASTVLLLQRRASAYVLAVGGVQACATLCSLAGLIWRPGGIFGLMAGYAAGSFVAGAGAALWLAVGFRGPFSLPVARRLVGYGLPLVPAALLMLVMNSVDRYALAAFTGLAAVGVYSAAFLLASAVNLVCVTPFRLMWGSLIWNIRRTEHERSTHRRVFEHYVLFQAVVIGFVIVAADRLMALLTGGDPEFMAAAWIIPVIYVGFVCLGAADVLSVGYFFESRTGYHLKTVAIAAAAAVMLNLVLVPQAGYAGSAFAYSLTFLVFGVIGYFFARRFFHAGHEWLPLGRRLLPVGAAVGAGVAARYQWPGASGMLVSLTVFAVLLAFIARDTLHRTGAAGLSFGGRR